MWNEYNQSRKLSKVERRRRFLTHETFYDLQANVRGTSGEFEIRRVGRDLRKEGSRSHFTPQYTVHLLYDGRIQ